MHISIRVLDVKQETQLHKRKPTSHQQQHASQLPFRSIFLQQPNCNATVMYMNRVMSKMHTTCEENGQIGPIKQRGSRHTFLLYEKTVY